MNIKDLKYINKTFIVTFLTSSSVVSACAFGVIWFYLDNIGRLDILYDALNVSSAIAIVFCFTLISLLGFSAAIFTPSFLLYLIYKSYEKELIHYDGLTLNFLRICALNSIIMCITVNGTFWLKYYFQISGYIALAITAFIVIFATYYQCNKSIFSVKNYIDTDKNLTEEFLQKKAFKFLFPILVITPAFMQVLPFLFLATQLEFDDENRPFAKFAIFLSLSLCLTIIGLLPGGSIINEKSIKSSIKNILSILIIIPIGVVAVSMLLRQTPNLIINKAVDWSGISDWRTHRYYIDSNVHSHRMFDGALWNTHYHHGIDSRFFITGVTAFSLGNVKLICPSQIKSARVASLKTTPDSFNAYDARISKLKKGAMKCIVFKKEEIHQWDSPISEPVFYQKVKSTSNSTLLNLLQAIK